MIGKWVRPKPFFLPGGERAVLLLHSFTSHPRDVRPLGRYLNKKGYTCYAPIYEGHGLPPEQLIETGPNDWWKSAEEGYRFLKKEGYQQIAVIGISLGGIFALKAAQQFDVNGIVIMSVPDGREVDALQTRVLQYARAYKRLEGKEEQQIDSEVEALARPALKSLVSFGDCIEATMNGLKKVENPIAILYGELDEPLYEESAEFIFDNVSASIKSVKSYPRSGHLMTLGKDQETIQNDIFAFLESLQWQTIK